VADALAALAAADASAYQEAAGRVLASFEERDAYLEDIPVAETVVVLEALASRRGPADLELRDLGEEHRRLSAPVDEPGALVREPCR